MSEEVNGKFHPRNRMVQLSTPYTDPEYYNAQSHIRDRWKARWEHDASSRFYCV